MLIVNMAVIFTFLILILLLFVRKSNNAYKILIFLISFSFFAQFLVGRSTEFNSFLTIFNSCFICLNIFLIIQPWSSANIFSVQNPRVRYFIFFRSILYKILFFNLFTNILILTLVLVFLPDIAKFKAESAYLKLYDQIPYFANIFRYAYITQNTGYLAIPIFFHYLQNSQLKSSIYALVLSISSLLSGFAFYSRAQIFTYTLIFLLYYLLIRKSLPNFIQSKISRFIKYSLFFVLVLFVSITQIRFSKMDYYGDRIPKNSVIKDPIIFSLFDYASQGYSNGLFQLERFTPDKSLSGEQFFRDIYQILNFFGLIKWDAKYSQELIDKAYDYDGGAFNGYTTPLVFNFGYIFTFLITILYHFSIKTLLSKKSILDLDSMFFLILLLVIPSVAIFYTGYTVILFPIFLLMVCRFLYSVKRSFFSRRIRIINY